MKGLHDQARGKFNLKRMSKDIRNDSVRQYSGVKNCNVKITITSKSFQNIMILYIKLFRKENWIYFKIMFLII